MVGQGRVMTILPRWVPDSRWRTALGASVKGKEVSMTGLCGVVAKKSTTCASIWRDPT